MEFEVIINIVCGLLPFLGGIFLLVPRVGLSVLGIYAGEETSARELKIARIAGGVALAIGVALNFLL